MRARIYRPAKSAMQSGMARTRHWVLEFFPQAARRPDPVMGWTTTADTQSQVRLTFASQAEAEAYAKAHGIDYIVLPPHERKVNLRPMGYGDNFAANRREAWTH